MKEAEHIYHSTSKEVSWMRISIFETSWKVEWIDTFIRIQIDIEICPSDGVDEIPVFVLWIEYDDISPHHERAENLELHSKRLSSS